MMTTFCGWPPRPPVPPPDSDEMMARPMARVMTDRERSAMGVLGAGAGVVRAPLRCLPPPYRASPIGPCPDRLQRSRPMGPCVRGRTARLSPAEVGHHQQAFHGWEVERGTHERGLGEAIGVQLQGLDGADQQAARVRAATDPRAAGIGQGQPCAGDGVADRDLVGGAAPAPSPAGRQAGPAPGPARVICWSIATTLARASTTSRTVAESDPAAITLPGQRARTIGRCRPPASRP